MSERTDPSRVRARWPQFRLRAARLGLWPGSPRPRSLAAAWRGGSRSERIAWVALGALFAAYMAAWVAGSLAWLFDPMAQEGDAMLLATFHRYGAAHDLAHDAFSAEQLSMIPMGARLPFLVLVPMFGLFVSIKIIQSLALLLVVAAAWMTARRRGGLALGILIVVLTLNHYLLLSAIAGGLPRAFAVPLLVLYGTGLIDRAWTRRALTLLAGMLVYPPAGAIMLSAEALCTLAEGVDLRRRSTRMRWVRSMGLAAAAALLGGVIMLESRAAGPVLLKSDIPSMGGAMEPRGRAQEVLFPEPLPYAASRLALHFTAQDREEGDAPAAVRWYRSLGFWPPLLAWLALAILVATRLTRVPARAACVLAGGVLFYWPASWLAFRFYVPARYIMYPADAGGVLLIAAIAGLVAWRAPRPQRTLARVGVAALLIAVLVSFTGPPGAGRAGLSEDGNRSARVVAALRALPQDSLIAAHPVDGDLPSFWAGRASVTGLECISPWRKPTWDRQLGRANETLTAYYSADRDAVLAYAAKWHVTHFLLSRFRFDPREWPGSADVDEPMGTHVRSLLAQLNGQHPALARVPASAVVWQNGSWVLVDAQALREAWSSATAP